MDIIGRGFLARQLETIADRHPGVVVIAAGVSSTGVTAEADFRREQDLVYATARRCRADGRRLVFFSSASAAMYGTEDCPGLEDGPVFPVSAYGRHKLLLERVLQTSGVDHQIFRCTHVIGAHQPDHQLLPNLVAQLRTGRIQVHRGACRDMIAADDFVRVIDALVAAWPDGRLVNVASGAPAPAERIVAHLEDRLGVRAEWKLVDRPMRYHVSTARLHALVPAAAGLGFGPRYYATVLDRYLPLYQEEEQ